MKGKKADGFAPPNYTQTPNTLFDLLPVISNAELRVTLALVRETSGWHRQRTEMLSVPELAALAGLSESSAKTGIKEATARGTLKRFRTRDAQNRPTYKYGLVIREDVPREEFERPKKSPENAQPDDSGTGSPRQNLTGSEFDGMNGSSGQNLTPSPVNSSGQNLTPSYKEERNISDVKKEEEHHAAEQAVKIPPERDDGGRHQEDQEDSAKGEQDRAPTPASVTENDLEGGDGDDQAGGGEEVPPAAWDPADVDNEISALTNRRWLKPWKPRGASEWQIPMIQEVDSSGVDRSRIAQVISPEFLAEIVARVRADLVRLTASAWLDPTVKVPSFQHLLIQALQQEVHRSDQVRQLVQEFAATQNALEAETPPAPTVAIARTWQVGDLVSYRRDQYEIVAITDRKITLESDQNGGVDIIRATSEMDALRLIRPVEAPAEESA